jgi:uncharacterized protein (TIGR02231 family)
MKRFSFAPWFCIVCLGVTAAALAQSEPVAVSSTIKEVTIYSDRARVSRSAKVSLKAGTTVCAFQKLPGWIDEQSIRIALASAGGGRITDVQARREYLARAGDEELRKAETAVREIADRLAALDDEAKVLDAQATQVEATRVFSLEKLPKDAAVREVNVESYGKVVDFVSDSLRKIAAARRDITAKRRDLEPELAARQRKLNDLQRLTQLEQYTVLVTVESAAPQEATLALTYILPGATWEPAHELRAEGRIPKAVQFSSWAVATQTTGEDWENADLTFSTQSPTETIMIPELGALLLDNSGAVAQITGQTESFQRAEQAYRNLNGFWYGYNNPKADIQTFNNSFAVQALKASRTAQVFKKLQARGTTAHFPGAGKATVRSDGSPVRVPIGQVELAAASRIVAAPQVSLNAVRTVELANTGKQPLLPGAVALYHDGAFLGVTDIRFIAEGETFPVFLGVADHVKLARVLDRKDSSLVRGSRNRLQVAFETTVENLSDTETTLRLTDRIPMSENKDIRVYRVRIAPEVDPDSNGLLNWNLILKPKARSVFRVEYSIEYPQDYVEHMKRARSSSSENAAPSSKVDLSVQIENLEMGCD